MFSIVLCNQRNYSSETKKSQFDNEFLKCAVALPVLLLFLNTEITKLKMQICIFHHFVFCCIHEQQFKLWECLLCMNMNMNRSFYRFCTFPLLSILRLSFISRSSVFLTFSLNKFFLVFFFWNWVGIIKKRGRNGQREKKTNCVNTLARLVAAAQNSEKKKSVKIKMLKGMQDVHTENTANKKR